MAEIKGSDLPAATSIIGTDIVIGVESSASKSITAEKILMTQSLTAADVRWKSNRVSPLSSKVGGSRDPDFAKFSDDGSGSQGVFLYHFDDTTEEELYVDVQANPDYKEDTAFYIQIWWIPKSNGGVGEKVSWGVEFNIAEPGGVFGNTTLFYSNIPLPNGDLIANRLYYTEIAIPAFTVSVGASSAARIFRDATGAGEIDDYTDDAMLISVEVKYEIDALGSSTRTVK